VLHLIKHSYQHLKTADTALRQPIRERVEQAVSDVPEEEHHALVMNKKFRRPPVNAAAKVLSLTAHITLGQTNYGIRSTCELPTANCSQVFLQQAEKKVQNKRRHTTQLISELRAPDVDTSSRICGSVSHKQPV